MPKFIAIDYSGSTGGVKEYWNKVTHFLKETNNSDATCIFWDDRKDPEVMNNEKAIIKAESRKGYDCTDPSTFIKYLSPEPDKEGINLIIFTDGQIKDFAVKKCEKLLDEVNIKIEKFKIFFIGPEASMNLSVAAPFMRAERMLEGVMNYEINVNDIKRQGVLKPVDRIIADIRKEYWEQPTKFLRDAPDILERLNLQNLGRQLSNEDFRNQLLKLKNNLLNSCAKEKESDDAQKIIKDLIASLKNKELASSMSKLEGLIKKLTDETGNKPEEQIEAYFQKILNIFDEKVNFSFDNLASNRITRAPNAEKIDIHDVEAPEIIEARYACPITCIEDVPILCIREGEPIFKGLDKKYQDYLISNPLAILEDPKLVDKIKKRIEHAFGFNTIKEIVKDKPSFISPMTRESISSFISTSTEATHQKVTQYALADLFFGGKLCGVPTLWLAVVFLVAKNIEYLRDDYFNDENDENETFIDNFKKCLIHQLEGQKTNMSLSGLPVDGPMIKVPVALALWYCIVSPSLDSVKNRLRTMGTRFHLQLLDEIAYPYDRQWALHQLAIYQVFALMLKQDKKDPKKLSKWVRSLYQNSVTLFNGAIIMLDGSPKHDPKLLRISLENIENASQYLNEDQYDRESDDFLLTLSTGEILTLYQYVDPSKTLGDIPIPNDMFELTIPAAETNYTVQENGSDCYTELCPFTLRPYSIDPGSKKEWKLAAEEKFGPLSDQVSIYNYFICYVIEKEKIPSQEEFIIWLAGKQSQREDAKKDTLPTQIQDRVSYAFNEFTKAAGKLCFSDECAEQANKHFKYFQIEKNNIDKKDSFTLADMPVRLFKQVTEVSRNKEKRLELELAYRQILSDGKIINARSFFTAKGNQLTEQKDESELRLSLGSK